MTLREMNEQAMKRLAKGGKLTEQDMERLAVAQKYPELADRYPYAAMYAFRHVTGLGSLMPFGEYNHTGYYQKGYKNEDEVYKACLEKGVDWEELLDYKGPDPDKIY